MTFVVQTPDGPRGFPDDMSQEEIRGVLLKQFPPVPTESQPQFDVMGNPTGGTVDVPTTPQMPYAEQMANVARGTGDVAKVVANGMTMGLADQGVAALRAATGNAPSYTDAIKEEQAKTASVGTATPGLNTALQGAGGVLTGMGLLGGGLSLGGNALRAGAGFLPRIAGFGADAALAGGVGGAAAVNTGNPSDYLKGAGKGAAEGAILGTALPVAGSLAGATYRSVAPFFARPVEGTGRTATGLIANALPENAATTLSELGPAGLLADVGPAMQGLTQGVAAKGPASNTVVDALRARQMATPSRLGADLETNLGPVMSPVELNSAMDARIAAAAPSQTAAVANAPPVMPTDALAEIGRRLATEPAGPTRSALLRAREMLAPEVNGVPAPVTDARTLLRARQNLDDMISYGDPLSGLSPGAAGGEGGPILAVRRALDRNLKDNIPGLSSADLSIASANKGKDAIEIGRKALGGGENVIHPQDLASSFNQLPLEQQALARAGARASIAGQVGTNPNDLASLRRIFGDVEDFNRAKSALLFGEQPTRNMLNAIDRESTFANTASPAISGSRTTPMGLASQAIDQAVKPAEPTIPKNVTSLGLLLHGLEWGLRKGAGAAAGVTGDQTRNQLAQALLASGPQRDNLVQALLADQLARANRSQAIRGLLSNPGIARGLLAAGQSANQ